MVNPANLWGAYRLYGVKDADQLMITKVDSSGTFSAWVDSATDPGANIRYFQGSFNASTNQISFSIAWFPGEVAFATFFTGYAIVKDIEGSKAGRDLGIPGLAGTWQQVRFVLPTSASSSPPPSGPRPATFPSQDEPAQIPHGHSGHIVTPGPGRLEMDYGGWFADNHRADLD